MSQHRKNHFLTLVLTGLLSVIILISMTGTSLAKTDKKESIQNISTDPILKKKANIEKKETQDETIIITPSEPPPQSLGDDPILPTRRLDKEAFTLGLSLVSGAITQFESSERLFMMTTGWSKYTEAQFAKELNVEIASNTYFGLNYGYKWLQHLKDYYEPYYKISIGGLFTTSENFGTFVNWKRYQLRGAIGLDDFLSLGRRVRIEANIQYSGFGVSLGLYSYYAF